MSLVCWERRCLWCVGSLDVCCVGSLHVDVSVVNLSIVSLCLSSVVIG